jgi:hypothetical protein
MFSFGTCNDPIFFDISNEVAPVPPYISGSPTNLAIAADGNLYVGKGKTLYRHDGTSWGIYGRSQERLYALAAASGYLLNLQDGMSLGNGEYSMKTIYAAGDEVFIGAKKGDDYYIIHLPDPNDISSFTVLFTTGNELLLGAAKSGSNYYLCAKNQLNESGGTIYTSSSPSSTSWTVASSGRT